MFREKANERAEETQQPQVLEKKREMLLARGQGQKELGLRLVIMSKSPPREKISKKKKKTNLKRAPLSLPGWVG